MMLYKQPVSDRLEKMDTLLKSVISGLEYNNISAKDAFDKLKNAKILLDQVKEYIQIEKE